jgi:hypothetical protein
MSVAEMRQRSKVGRNTETKLIGLSYEVFTRYFYSDHYQEDEFYTTRGCAEWTFEERGGSRLLWEETTRVDR